MANAEPAEDATFPIEPSSVAAAGRAFTRDAR